MKIEIAQIQAELEENFPNEKVVSGYEIDEHQLKYLEDLMKKTYKTIQEKVFSETFNMFDYKSFINDCKKPEEKHNLAQLSEMVTEKALCVFLMNPEYFEQHFGSSKALSLLLLQLSGY